MISAIIKHYLCDISLTILFERLYNNFFIVSYTPKIDDYVSIRYRDDFHNISKGYVYNINQYFICICYVPPDMRYMYTSEFISINLTNTYALCDVFVNPIFD